MIIHVHTDDNGRLDTILWTDMDLSYMPAYQEFKRIEVPDDFDQEANPGDYILKEGTLVYSPTVSPMDLLNAQITALTERNEFLEDCVAEMAEQVYGD